jgi:hypothetical protein
MTSVPGVPAAPVDEDRCPSGIAVAVGAAALVTAAIVGATLTRGVAFRLGGMVLTIAVLAAVAGDGRAALAVGGLAWPIGNGFLVNRFGELRWHAGLDVWFVAGLLAAVAIGMTIAQVRREVRARALMRPFVILPRADWPEIPPAGAAGRFGSVTRSPARVTEAPVVDGATGRGHKVLDLIFVLLTLALFGVSSGLLDPKLLLKSTPDALRKLNPATLWRNPVMFIVEVRARSLASGVVWTR